MDRQDRASLLICSQRSVLYTAVDVTLPYLRHIEQGARTKGAKRVSAFQRFSGSMSPTQRGVIGLLLLYCCFGAICGVNNIFTLDLSPFTA